MSEYVTKWYVAKHDDAGSTVCVKGDLFHTIHDSSWDMVHVESGRFWDLVPEEFEEVTVEIETTVVPLRLAIGMIVKNVTGDLAIIQDVRNDPEDEYPVRAQILNGQFAGSADWYTLSGRLYQDKQDPHDFVEVIYDPT